jgi:hypothetical protein
VIGVESWRTYLIVILLDLRLDAAACILEAEMQAAIPLIDALNMCSA